MSRLKQRECEPLGLDWLLRSVMKTRVCGVLLWLLGAFLVACGSSSSEGLECGEGTVEEDGACVVVNEETDDGTSSGAASGGEPGGSTSDAGSGNADGGKVGSTSSASATATDSAGDDAPYGACPGGSDVECTGFETCDTDLGMCTQSCSSDTDCRNPTGGTAIQRCENAGDWSDICVIFCGVEGFECPSGMTCRDTMLCRGSEGGGSSTGSGDCESPSLEICVWE